MPLPYWGQFVSGSVFITGHYLVPTHLSCESLLGFCSRIEQKGIETKVGTLVMQGEGGPGAGGIHKSGQSSGWWFQPHKGSICGSLPLAGWQCQGGKDGEVGQEVQVQWSIIQWYHFIETEILHLTMCLLSKPGSGKVARALSEIEQTSPINTCLLANPVCPNSPLIIVQVQRDVFLECQSGRVCPLCSDLFTWCCFISNPTR